MDKKIILPFEVKPLSVMYHNLAFPLGIIQGNAKCDITPWLCHKFINCMFNPASKNIFSISLSDNWGAGDKMMFHQHIQLFNDTYDIVGIDIIQVLINMLANGYYVAGYYNEEYIPGKRAYGVEYFPHDYLLIGFNNEKEVFYSVGYLTEQFVDYEISYANMRKALTTVASRKPALNFFQYNSEADIAVNLEKILSALKDYLSSSNSLPQYTKGLAYGLDAINNLGEYYASYGNQSNFDHRYTKGLTEHKSIMLRRIKYLCSHQYITDNEYVSRSERVLEYSSIIHNLGIRFKLLGDYNILQEIKSIIKNMNELELSYLVSVKKDLDLYKERNKM